MTTPGTVTIRQRHHNDLEQLKQVLIRVHDRDGYPVEGVTTPETWLHAPNELAAWTALIDDEAIGHIALCDAHPQDEAAATWVSNGGNYADIAVPVRLFVDPAHRGRRAAHQLMFAAYQHAAQLDKRLVFDVMLKDTAAIQLYESLSCQHIGTITHHHGEGLQEPAAVYAAPTPAAS